MDKLSCATLGITDKKMFMTPPLDSHSTTEPKLDMLLAVSTGYRIWCHGKMYAALCMHMCVEKTTFFWKRRLNHLNITSEPKKSIPLIGVSGGTQVFAKQLNRHIIGFPTKNLTISDHYFQRFHCQKKNICNSAVFSPTALLQISFVEIILRLPVGKSLIA